MCSTVTVRVWAPAPTFANAVQVSMEVPSVATRQLTPATLAATLRSFQVQSEAAPMPAAFRDRRYFPSTSTRKGTTMVTCPLVLLDDSPPACGRS